MFHIFHVCYGFTFMATHVACNWLFVHLRYVWFSSSTLATWPQLTKCLALPQMAIIFKHRQSGSRAGRDGDQLPTGWSAGGGSTEFIADPAQKSDQANTVSGLEGLLCWNKPDTDQANQGTLRVGHNFRNIWLASALAKKKKIFLKYPKKYVCEFPNNLSFLFVLSWT